MYKNTLVILQIISSHEFSQDMLDEKMKENERRRRKAVKNVDPEMSQYLEDERLAIMLQNSEFLQELRGNEDFMKTLEKGTDIIEIKCDIDENLIDCKLTKD